MSDFAHMFGRALLSVIFIVSGYLKLTAIAGTTTYLTRIGVPMPQVMVYVVVLVELVGGLMILVGFKTRWTALLLFVFTGATLYLGHKFWVVPPDQYMNQLNHAMKNLAIMGGFLLLVAHGGGRWSLDHGR